VASAGPAVHPIQGDDIKVNDLPARIVQRKVGWSVSVDDGDEHLRYDLNVAVSRAQALKIVESVPKFTRGLHDPRVGNGEVASQLSPAWLDQLLAELPDATVVGTAALVDGGAISGSLADQQAGTVRVIVAAGW